MREGGVKEEKQDCVWPSSAGCEPQALQSWGEKHYLE